MGRTLVVHADDTLILQGYEVCASILLDIVKPNKRLLWAFVRSEDGTRIRPVPYSEDKILWLEDSDIERTKAEERDLLLL